MDDLLLYKFLQNEASEDEIRTVLDWLDADPANRKYFDGLDNMLNAARVNRPAGRKPQRRPLPTLRNIGAWSMRIAAVLCLCLGVSYFAATKMFDRKASNNSLSVFVPNGERISMTLTDGTTVWLNSGAKLEYPSIFSRKTRRVKISGEAMFEVEHDASRPFIVETFACDAEVLGTKFNIEAYPDSETITTTLLEGSVEVESRLSRECIRMVPSQQLSYDIQSGEMKLSTISDSKEPVRWKDNVWVLHQTPFTQVCHRLEQMFNVKIVIMNDKFIGKKFTGEFRFGDSLESILEVIRITTPFTYEREEDTIILK